MTGSPANGPARAATILVANDHEWTARSLETILTAEGYQVVRAFTATQALAKAADVRPDACVLDVQLPDLDGMSLCEALRRDPAIGATVPIFLTTAGPSGRQERVASYRAGAWEFFGQPLDGEMLLLKLRTYVDAKRVVDELRGQSLLDEVTGLYSRRGLLRRGRELASDAARRGRPLACVVLRPEVPELESAVAAAEALAQRVGEFLRLSGRSADVLGRVGPLEFGVIAADAGDAEVRQLIRRLNEGAARSALPDAIGSSRFSFRAAFCAVDADEARTVDLDAMLRRATSAVGGVNSEPVITSVGH